MRPPESQHVDITTYYLEMHDMARLRPRRSDDPRWQLRRAARDIAINRDFYRRVGADWTWTDRLPWSDQRWQQYIDQPGLQTWIAYLGDEAVGYFELDQQPDSGVEIAYFGLLPEFVGRGLGGPLLTAAIEQAWQLNPPRVWVHTCTLDHPQALANYLARGLEIYQTTTHRQST